MSVLRPKAWHFIGHFIIQSGSKFPVLEGPDMGEKKFWLTEKAAFDALLQQARFMAQALESGENRDHALFMWKKLLEEVEG